MIKVLNPEQLLQDLQHKYIRWEMGNLHPVVGENIEKEEEDNQDEIQPDQPLAVESSINSWHNRKEEASNVTRKFIKPDQRRAALLSRE